MDIATLIQNFGFPVTCVIGCAWFVYIMWKKSVEQNDKREDRLYTELGKAITANEKFAEIISSYTSKLDSIQSDVKEIKESVGR